MAASAVASRDGGAQGPLHLKLDDWRRVAGLRYFHAFVLTEGPERTFTYRYRLIEPDAVGADRFVRPTEPAGRDE